MVDHAAGEGRRAALQRIGLSATQKPIADVANLLVGVGRACELVDIGHRRDLDLAIEVPDSAARDGVLARDLGRDRRIAWPS